MASGELYLSFALKVFIPEQIYSVSIFSCNVTKKVSKKKKKQASDIDNSTNHLISIKSFNSILSFFGI